MNPSQVIRNMSAVCILTGYREGFSEHFNQFVWQMLGDEYRKTFLCEPTWMTFEQAKKYYRNNMVEKYFEDEFTFELYKKAVMVSKSTGAFVMPDWGTRGT